MVQQKILGLMYTDHTYIFVADNAAKCLPLNFSTEKLRIATSNEERSTDVVLIDSNASPNAQRNKYLYICINRGKAYAPRSRKCAPRSHKNKSKMKCSNNEIERTLLLR